jgi:hypothetical protein
MVRSLAQEPAPLARRRHGLLSPLASLDHDFDSAPLFISFNISRLTVANPEAASDPASRLRFAPARDDTGQCLGAVVTYQPQLSIPIVIQIFIYNIIRSYIKHI